MILVDMCNVIIVSLCHTCYLLLVNICNMVIVSILVCRTCYLSILNGTIMHMILLLLKWYYIMMYSSNIWIYLVCSCWYMQYDTYLSCYLNEIIMIIINDIISCWTVSIYVINAIIWYLPIVLLESNQTINDINSIIWY